MYSNSISKSLDRGQNRFELCHQAFKAIRKLHNPGNRVQDTTNDALQRLAGAERPPAEQTAHVSEAAVVEVKQESSAMESPAGGLQPAQMA